MSHGAMVNLCARVFLDHMSYHCLYVICCQVILRLSVCTHRQVRSLPAWQWPSRTSRGRSPTDSMKSKVTWKLPYWRNISYVSTHTRITTLVLVQTTASDDFWSSYIYYNVSSESSHRDGLNMQSCGLYYTVHFSGGSY